MSMAKTIESVLEFYASGGKDGGARAKDALIDLLRLRRKPLNQEVLDFIKDYYDTHGVQPTLRQIAAEVSSTPNSIHYVIKRLARDGLVKLEKGENGRYKIVGFGEKKK